MKTCSFETSGTDCHVTRRHIPEEWYPFIAGSIKVEELDQLSGYQLLGIFIPWFELELVVLLQGDTKCSVRALVLVE
jgi:hypothetical protein